MTDGADTSPPKTLDPKLMDLRSIDTLRAIMVALRTPVTGCPWDLEQNFGTIAPYTIEEAFEVADAIQRGSRKDLCEELGDLLLQPIYHAQMAAEEGSFNLDDVLESVNRKMINRHPHVFGDAKSRAAGVAKGFWEANKAKERVAKGNTPAGTLDGIALALPGLTRALKLQAKAAKLRPLYIIVDSLKLRASPKLDSNFIRYLTYDELVFDMGEQTESTQTIRYSAEEVRTEPWVKIRTEAGEVGWVFGAGVGFYRKKRRPINPNNNISTITESSVTTTVSTATTPSASTTLPSAVTTATRPSAVTTATRPSAVTTVTRPSNR